MLPKSFTSQDHWKYYFYLILGIVILALLKFAVEYGSIVSSNTDAFFLPLVSTISPSKHLIIDKGAIWVKSLEFIDNQTNHQNPELVEFVRSLMQKGQNQFIKTTNVTNTLSDLSFLSKKNDGLYLEVGVRDLVSPERTMLLSQGWDHVAVESSPAMVDLLLVGLNDRSSVLNSCISLDKSVKLVKKSYQEEAKDFFEFEQNQNSTFVPCFRLNSIFLALRPKRVDYMMLNLNENKLAVLKSVDWKAANLSLLRMRISKEDPSADVFIKWMVTKEFAFMRQIDTDLFFANKNG